MSDADITLAGQSLGLTVAELTRRAQGWPTIKRLRKLQEECGECIAAVARYSENPSAYLREKLAEELEGLANTLRNVQPDFAEECESVRPRQLLRFRAHLERDGL